MKFKIHAWGDLPGEIMLQRFTMDFAAVVHSRSGQRMGRIFHSPEEIAEWPSFQSGRIGKRGDVFADHIRLIPILLELKPFFLRWI